MKKMLFVFFALCISLNINLTQLSAQIIEAPTLDSFEEALKELDANSLVLLDVDDTLLMPKDCILQSNAERYVLQYSKDAYLETNKNAPKNIPALIWAKMQYETVNPKLVDIVQDLQIKNIKTIAFTNAPIGPHDSIPSMEDWRIEHLKQNQFDFSSAFPDFPLLPFDLNTGIFARFKTPAPVLFKLGVLYANGQHKGPVLKAFLKVINCKPSIIFFLDDRLDYLKSVEKALEGSDIAFVGFHYTEAKAKPCKVNGPVARFQFLHLYRDGEWLNDDEAAAHILQN